MGKYLSKYGSIDAFNLDASILSYPHVSLIEDTGEIKYHPYIPPTMNIAPFGSIAIYNRTKDSFIIVDNPDDYSDTEYLTENYMPFAICIDPKTNRNDNKAVWMVHPSVLYILTNNNSDWGPLVYHSSPTPTTTQKTNLYDIINTTNSTIEKNTSIRALNENDYTKDIATDLPFASSATSTTGSMEDVYNFMSFVASLKLGTVIPKGTFYAAAEDVATYMLNNFTEFLKTWDKMYTESKYNGSKYGSSNGSPVLISRYSSSTT